MIRLNWLIGRVEQRSREVLADALPAAFRVRAVLDQVLSTATPMACHDVAMLVAGISLAAKPFSCCSTTLGTFALSAALKYCLKIIIGFLGQKRKPILTTAFTFAW